MATTKKKKKKKNKELEYHCLFLLVFQFASHVFTISQNTLLILKVYPLNAFGF